MQIVIAAVGRPRGEGLSEAIHEYESRAARYWPLRIVEVRAESARGTPEAVVREKEAGRLLSTVPKARVVACEAQGRTMRSEEFAAWLQSERERASDDLAFVIGGAYGLGESIRKAASEELSLSPWTLSHELARLILTEQIYRAGTIVRGEPYHK